MYRGKRVHRRYPPKAPAAKLRAAAAVLLDPSWRQPAGGAGPARHVLSISGWHPVRLNELLGSHWARRNRLKRADAELIACYSRMAGIPAAEGRRRVSITVVVPSDHRGRLPDPDAFLKSCLDGLVACRLLKDDSGRWCVLGDIKVERGPDRATTIMLEDLS